MQFTKNMKKSSLNYLVNIFIIIFSILLTIISYQYYFLGDQLTYIDYYNSFQESHFWELVNRYDFEFMREYLDYGSHIQKTFYEKQYSFKHNQFNLFSYFFGETPEIVFYGVTKTFNFFNVNRLTYLILTNILLVLLILIIIDKYKTPINHKLIFFFTNYYFFVILLSAERLKIAFIFFLLGFIFVLKNKTFYLLIILSIFAHIQMIFYTFCIGLQYFYNKSNISYKKSLLIIIFILIYLISYLLVQFEHLINQDQILNNKFEYLIQKMRAYMETTSLSKTTKDVFILSLLYLSLFSNLRTNTNINIFFGFMLISVLMLSGDRLLIFAYFGYFYFILSAPKKGLIFNLISFYLFLKSLIFFYNLVIYHDPFSEFMNSRNLIDNFKDMDLRHIYWIIFKW